MWVRSPGSLYRPIINGDRDVRAQLDDRTRRERESKTDGEEVRGRRGRLGAASPRIICTLIINLHARVIKKRPKLAMDRAATGFVDYRDTDRETGKSAVCVTESLPAALSSSVVTRSNEVGAWSREYQGNRPDEKLKIDRAETFSLGRYRQSMEIDGQVSRAFPAELSSLSFSFFVFLLYRHR